MIENSIVDTGAENPRMGLFLERVHAAVQEAAEERNGKDRLAIRKVGIVLRIPRILSSNSWEEVGLLLEYTCSTWLKFRRRYLPSSPNDWQTMLVQEEQIASKFSPRKVYIQHSLTEAIVHPRQQQQQQHHIHHPLTRCEEDVYVYRLKELRK